MRAAFTGMVSLLKRRGPPATMKAPQWRSSVSHQVRSSLKKEPKTDYRPGMEIRSVGLVEVRSGIGGWQTTTLIASASSGIVASIAPSRKIA
jgi:hypothetical protein